MVWSYFYKNVKNFQWVVFWKKYWPITILCPASFWIHSRRTIDCDTSIHLYNRYIFQLDYSLSGRIWSQTYLNCFFYPILIFRRTFCWRNGHTIIPLAVFNRNTYYPFTSTYLFIYVALCHTKRPVIFYIYAVYNVST